MTQTTTPAPSQSGALRRLPLIVLALGAVAGALLMGDRLSFEALAEHRETLLAFRDAHYAVAVAGFVTLYAVIVAFSLPGATVMTLTGGFLFATFPGALYNVTGATLGAVALFLAVRAGFGARLAARMDTASGRTGRLKAAIDSNQWEMLFVLRLVPLVPFFVANLLPALVGVPLYRFAVSTFLGIMPGAVVYTSVGAGLGAVMAAGERPDLGVIFEPAVLLPLLGLAALAALPAVLRAVRGRSGE